MKTKLILSALCAAGAAFLLGRFGPGGATVSQPSAEGGKQPAGASGPAKETPSISSSVASLRNSIQKRQHVLSLIDAAKTGAELESLMKEFSGDESAEAAIASRWGTVDPQGCLSWLRFFPQRNVEFPHHITQALFRAWAASDPAGAMAAALSSQNIPDLNIASLIVAEAAMQTDLQAGGKLLAERGTFPDIFVFPEDLWKVDPAGLVKAVLPAGVVPDKNLTWALDEPLKAWSAKKPAEVLEWLQTLPLDVMAPILPSAIGGLAAKDPEAAIKLIATVPQAEARESAAAGLAVEWVKVDPSKAFIYAVTHGVTRPQITLKKMSMALLEKGSAATVAAFSALPQGKVWNQVLPALAREWLETDPAEASKFLAGLPASQQRNDAVKIIAKTWTENSPQDMLKFLQANPGPELNEVYDRVLSRHAGFNPAEAVNFAAQQSGERGIAGIRAAFNTLSTEYQMEDAAALIKQLPSAPMQAEAVRSFMEPFATGQRLFDEGLKWAAALAPELKAVARETLLRSSLITPGERGRAEERLK